MVNDFREIDSSFNEFKMKSLLVNALSNILNCLAPSGSETSGLFIPNDKAIEAQKKLLKQQCELITSMFEASYSWNYFVRIAARIANSIEKNDFTHWFNNYISLYDDNYTSEPLRVIYHQPYRFNISQVDEKNRFVYSPETLILANHMRHKTIPKKNFILIHTISLKMKSSLQIQGCTAENISYAAVSVDDKSLPLAEVNTTFLLICFLDACIREISSDYIGFDSDRIAALFKINNVEVRVERKKIFTHHFDGEVFENTRMVFNHPYLKNNYDYSVDTFFSSNDELDFLYENSPDIKPSIRHCLKFDSFAVCDIPIDSHAADNTNEVFYFNHRTIHFELDENISNIRLSKPYSDVIRYNYQRRIIYVAKGGKLLFGRKGNYTLSDIRRSVKQLVPDFIEKQIGLGDSFIMRRKFFHNYLYRSNLKLLIPSSSEEFLHTYYYKDNLFEFAYRFWRDEDADLVYEEFKKNQIIYRRKAARLAKQGDTVAAIDALFYDYKFPPSIKRSLYCFELMPKSTIAKLHDCIDRYGVDSVRNLLQFLIDRRILKNTVIYIEFLALGFSWKKITNTLVRTITDNTQYLFFDTFSMYNAVSNSKYAEYVNNPYEMSSIRHYHDYLQAVMNQIAFDNKERFSAPHKSAFEPFYHKSYVVRPVQNTAELLKIGTVMHHCVSSYQDKHNKGGIEIMVVGSDTNSYVVCIEVAISKSPQSDEKIVVNYRLTQAKMSYNRQVSSDPLLNEVVVAWANAHDIPINTIDVNAYGE